jgi:dihydrofolate reductase
LIKVFIATSLDGFIADHNGSVDFLYKYPDIPNEDMGYVKFISSIDAILMGRKTFETVLGFGVEWPYKKPVYVWTSALKKIPSELEGKVFYINGTPETIISTLGNNHHNNIYLDGGKTIQSFLNEGLVDEMIITTIPVLLGSGIFLFGELKTYQYFECTDSKHYSNGTTQSTFVRTIK